MHIHGKSAGFLPEPFLTIPGREDQNERGLQAIAFAPDFAATGKVYVSVVSLNQRHEVLENTVDPTDPNRVDPAT
ncbi:MAG: hypothetical protein AAF568_09655, partial [Pseudomonadota bacterium]